MVWAFGVFSLLMLVGCVLYHGINHKKGYLLYICLKLFASGIFVAAGIYANVRLHFSSFFALWILSGFGFSFIGDFLLAFAQKKGERYFLAGMFSFLITHLLFICGLCQLTCFHILDMVVAAVILALCGLLIHILKLELGQLKIPVLAYCCAIGFMVTKSFSLYASAGHMATAVLFSAGAVLFLLSDAVLAVNKFSSSHRPFLDAVNTFTYFPGQLLIAFSLFLL